MNYSDDKENVTMAYELFSDEYFMDVALKEANKAFENEEVPAEKRFFKFWPDHVTTEILVGVVLMYVLTILALVFPAELGEPANPTQTPAHITPEWYFYFSFRLLKLVSLQASVIITMIIGGLIFLWPFIEEQFIKRFKISEKVPIILGVLAFGAFLALTVWEAMAT